MARQGNLLSDVQLRLWMAKGDPIARSDGDGLTFTLSPAGTATWILRYRISGVRRKEITLGNYPDLTLAAARKLARERRVEVDLGRDPAAEKKVQKMRAKAAWTVRELIADYQDKKLTTPPLAEGTIYYRKWDLDNVIGPKLGSMDVREVRPADIVHVIESSKRSWTICKRLLTSAKKLFAHACGKRLIDVNPCVGIELTALMGSRPPVRKRVMLTEAELRMLLKDVNDLGVENGFALRILLATCVRSIELVKARWEHIDFEAGTWWVPDESVKTRSGFLVPITPTVAEWFQNLKLLACGSPWVLPARTERRRKRAGDTHVGKTTLWAAITRAFERGEMEVQRFTPHDTRSTAKGHMRNMGIPNEITEIALNHTLKGMEAVYDVREEIPERRIALEQWAAFIKACEMGRPWKNPPARTLRCWPAFSNDGWLEDGREMGAPDLPLQKLSSN
jgi:integrase